MLLGFKDQFEAPILAKIKRHTIRDYRKGERQIQVGDRLDCYVKARQKGMRLIGRWTCVKVQDIEIIERPDLRALYRSKCVPLEWVWVDGIALSVDEREALAKSDGFGDFAEMMNFWDGRLPFNGVMIHWNPDEPVESPKERGRLSVNAMTSVRERQLEERVAELEKDKARLVAMHIKAGLCPFGNLQPGQIMVHCPSGFPGCGCADEMMVNAYLQESK